MSDVPGRSSQAVRRAVRKARAVARRDSSPEAVTPPREQPSRPADAPTRPKSDPRFARGYWRVSRALLGEDAVPESHDGWAFPPSFEWELPRQIRRTKALARFAELLSTGTSLAAAHVATTRELVALKQGATARAFTLGLQDQPGGEQIQHLGVGLVLHGLRLWELAWARFSLVDTAALTELVPVEAVQCALEVGTPESTDVALTVASDPTLLGTSDLVDLAGRYLVAGHPEVARRLIDEADARDVSVLDDHQTEALENLHRWTHPAEPAVPPAGAIRIGVIDYHQPDLEFSSKNVGDYVQTLAMLGNLARFQKARFTGDEGLGELATELQGRVRSELALDAGEADVHLLPVSRDYSEGDAIPEDTWMVAFGWHMHPLFRLRFGLPYHPHLNPIFVSFHINRIAVLTPEAIDYLKAHGPIGCRDWTTVDLLLSAGVDAFFTGCLTTTVNAVFPDLDEVDRDADRVVAAIDYPVNKVKAKRPVEWVTHGDLSYRTMSLVEGTRAATELLAGYQQRFQRIVTSRLHSYLPATSLGVPVSFRPNIPGDVRFEGLYGMEPGRPEFEAMRDGIRSLINQTFELVLAGADRDTVYARWREITADRVAEARARFAAPPKPLATTFDLAGAVGRIRAGQRTFGPHDSVDAATVTDVAVSLDANLAQQLPVTLESIVTNASGPVRLWITARGLSPDYEAWVGRAFPDVPITFLNFDGIDYGVIGRMIKHITVATMDRLLLPEVLTELDRITYIDIDTVTEGDVCELAATDLGGHPLAARTSVYPGAQIWRSAGDDLEPDVAAELRRTMSARHEFDFLTFNAGVLVLDLRRMREDAFAAQFVPMAGEYGLNDQDILCAYVGPARAELDPRWNALPVQEIVSDPGVMHFAGAGKPWSEELTAYGDRWAHYADQLARRVGTPPAG
jgi:lipopolysaccharide biosynthesis glycosyltransferase